MVVLMMKGIGLCLLIVVLVVCFISSANGATFTVTNTNNSGPGSLRQAILDANADSEASTIIFNIPTSDLNYESTTGTWRITLASELPYLNDASGGTTIDGSTQKEFIGSDTNPDGPEIEINGNKENISIYGLRVSTANNTIKELVINNCKNSGIEIYGTNANKVIGCYIGTDVTGEKAVANGGGIEIKAGAKDNTIGGTTEGERNIISGNARYGVYIYGDNTNNNEVIGNFIGTDRSGTSSLPNGDYGVRIRGGAQYNTIGGTTSSRRNIISGNGLYGVFIENTGTDYNKVIGNYIGTDVGGTANLGNGRCGILITRSAMNNTIGGSGTGEGNIIAFNGDQAIYLSDKCNNCQIIGNTIHSNDLDGNKDGAILINTRCNDCKIIRNTIYSNGKGGICLKSGNERVRIENNIIYSNPDVAIYLSGVDTTSGNGNIDSEIVNNTIYNNNGGGIWLINGSTKATLFNNIIWAKGSSRCINVDGTSTTGFASDYNDFFTTDTATVGSYKGTDYPTLSDWNKATGQDADSISEDPLFINAEGGNFHIQDTSPCKDAGINTFNFKNAPEKDIDGETRSTPYDIGADEFGVILSLSLSNNTFAFGTQLLDRWLDPQSTVITNDGSVAENFIGTLSQFSTTDGYTWEIGKIEGEFKNGEDRCRAQWSIISADEGPWWNDISSYNTNFTIATDVSVGGEVTLYFKIQTPTKTTSFNEYSSTLTVTAEKY
ncbi:MAG: right-handed parallel beta-helix repeat-containing protein [bacterium]|nr:right-handed parallel beta-helix repeat-containing protein [bacterium]